MGPDGFYFAACGDFGGEVGGCAAVAHYGFGGYGGCGVVVWPLTLDGFGGGGGGEAGVAVGDKYQMSLVDTCIER